jgi:hypothetical protein
VSHQPLETFVVGFENAFVATLPQARSLVKANRLLIVMLD